MQQVRAKVLNAQKAVHETFFSVKDIFEKHNVVFTIGASLASAGAAWAGYTARQMHQKKVEDRLNSIEHAMATVHNLEEEHVKALTSSIGVSYAACAATAGTTLVIGYGFGFRGGRWFTLRKIQKQQQRLLNPRTPIRLSQVLRGEKPAGDTQFLQSREYDCSTSWFSVMSDAADFEWKLSVLLP